MIAGAYVVGSSTTFLTVSPRSDGCSCADTVNGKRIPVSAVTVSTEAERRAARCSVFTTSHLRSAIQQRVRRTIFVAEVVVVRGLKRSGSFGRCRFELACARHGGAREIAENRRIRLARRPAVRAPFFDHVVAQGPPSIAFPQGAKVERVVAQVADLGVPDRARVQVPVGVDEAGRGERRTWQRRLARFIVAADERLVTIL